MNQQARAILARAPVVPVITISDLAIAVPLARALVAGGIPVLEITLRTPQGLPAIRRIKAEVPDAIVGAGTVLNSVDLHAAVQAGSEFIITPGLTPGLLQAGVLCGVPFIPGVATISEAMACVDEGLVTLKFFPAEASGGAATVAAFAGPLPDVRFCPTGGIGLHNMADYLALPNVLSVGGSWLAPRDLIAAKDWQAIQHLAEQTCQRVAAQTAN